MQLIEQLKAYDIDIQLTDGSRSTPRTCRISIPTPLQQPPTDTPNRSSSIDDTKHHTLIVQEGTAWVFRMWDSVPGPSADDFMIAFPNVEDAITAVLQYHLGGPTLLGPWLVPLHRHPELSLAHVRFRLSQATMVDVATFAGIAERRHQKIVGNYQFGTNRWEWALQTQFLAISHLNNPHLTLHLRRDAQEAYIASTATQP